jgi:uncharacterized SAM-dependent methyltransferase
LHSSHLQYAAGTGGKKATADKLAARALNVAAQLGSSLVQFISIAAGRTVELSTVFEALAASSSQLSYLSADMAEGFEHLTAAQVQRAATTLQQQSGSAGGELRFYAVCAQLC